MRSARFDSGKRNKHWKITDLVRPGNGKIYYKELFEC